MIDSGFASGRGSGCLFRSLKVGRADDGGILEERQFGMLGPSGSSA